MGDRDTLLKRICGSTHPALLSSRNYLHLRFRLGENVTRKGFKLRWKIDKNFLQSWLYWDYHQSKVLAKLLVLKNV